MKRLPATTLITFAAILCTSAALSQSQPPTAKKETTNADKQQKNVQSHESEDDGQRIFEANCSRCHNAPEGFSPRISGTIVRHMRVRASLSGHDEKELLRFFNP